jgi:hypothetical protein
MAEYLLRDRDKAAFINHMNKILGQMEPELGLDTTNFLDIPGSNKSEDKTIFVTDNPQEIGILDTLINNKSFSYPVKKIDLKEMAKSSREQA